MKRMVKAVVKHPFLSFVIFFGITSTMGLLVFRFITENIWEPCLENKCGITVLIIFLSAFFSAELITYQQEVLEAKAISNRNM